jgi:hypothetical protein
LSSEDSLDLYLGGIVGKITNSSITGTITNYSINSGKISVNSNYTNYVANRVVSLYIGGVAGKSINTAIEFAKNTGEIAVKTNSHKTFIGGLVGDSDGTTISNAKNNGNIDVEYSSNYKVISKLLLDEIGTDDLYGIATMDIGGVVGRTNKSLELLSNLSSISLKTLSETTAHISIGGVAGRIKYEDEVVNLTKSYNSGAVSSSSNKSSTFGIGGLVGTIDLNGEKTESSKLIVVKDNYNNGFISSDNICSVYMGGIVGYVYNNGDTQENYVLIQNNINIGYVTIYDFASARNALGAIIGYGKYCYLSNPDGDYTSDDVNARKSFDLNNYYLSGSAYSGDSNLFAGYCEKVNNYYTSKQEDIDDNFYKGEDKDKYFFAKALSSSDLKEKSSYEMRKVKETDDTTYTLDFTTIWECKYGTWYPTLKENASTAYWVDNTMEVSKYASTYLVSSAEELAYLSKIINNGQLDSTGITIKLTRSIDLANKYFTPIGTESNPFKGTFDGGLYEIKNLTIDKTVKYIDGIGDESLEDCKYGGLFGVVNGATIKNVGLENPIIDNVDYAGGIVAKATDSSLSYLYTDCTKKSLTFSSGTSYISGNFGAGGIVCLLSDSKDSGSARKGLYNSYNNVFVRAKNATTATVGALVGGLSNSYVYNCYNGDYGVITVADNTKYSGIVGKIDDNSDIKDIFSLCLSLETLTGTTSVIAVTPSIYVISDGKVVANNVLPSYENLTGDDKEDVWTKDYSLNTSGYPSLRGLNREWKNLSSEAISSFEYSKATKVTNKNSIYNYLDSYKKIYDEDGNLLSGKIDYSLANFAQDSFYDVSVSKIYLISSAEDLVWVANNVNSGNLITSGVEFMLISDIDLSGRYFTPIGLNRTNSFRGIFNFNGHVIKGLTIDSSYTYSGLFGYTQDASIINGYLINAFIKINIKTANTKSYSGSLVGYAENTNIKNIVVSSSISAKSNGGAYVGGLVGYFSKTDVSSTIENVRVYGGANADVDGFVVDVRTVDAYGNTTITSSNVITEGGIDQENKKVNIVGYSVDEGAYVGGVVGYAIVSVDETYNLKELISYATVDIGVAGVSLTSASTAHVGVGCILGYGANLVKINACEVLSGAVAKSYSNKFDSVGGIAGYNANGEIKNCKFAGYIEARTSGRDSLEQSIWSYVGGIVGICYDGIVSSCYANGSTIPSNISNKNYSKGSIIGLATGKSYGYDQISIYNVNDTNGFGDSVNAVGQEENIIGAKVYTDVYKKSSDVSINADNGFDATLWNSETLLCKKVFVMGGGTIGISAYVDEANEKNLLTEGSEDRPAGMKVDDLSTLKLKQVSGTVGLVYIVGERGTLTYKYVEKTLDGGTDVSVESLLESPSSDDYIIAVFIIKK